MKKIFIILVLSIMLFGCSDTEVISYKTIAPEEAYNMISSNPDIIILDVRTAEEYETGHLENAINIPHTEIADTFSADNTSTIIVYCKSGVRAKTASETLINLGYTNVYTFGGINSWTHDTTTE